AAAPAVAFSPVGNLLATAGMDNTVKVWNSITGQQRFELSGHTAAVCAVAFSPDGQTLASAGWDGTVRLWDPFTATPRATFRDKVPPATTAAGVPPKKTSLSSLGIAKLPAPPAGTKVATSDLVLPESQQGAEPPRPSAQGVQLLLATAGNNQAIILWDPTSGKEITRLQGHARDVNALTFSPDGKY